MPRSPARRSSRAARSKPKQRDPLDQQARRHHDGRGRELDQQLRPRPEPAHVVGQADHEKSCRPREEWPHRRPRRMDRPARDRSARRATSRGSPPGRRPRRPGVGRNGHEPSGLLGRLPVQAASQPVQPAGSAPGPGRHYSARAAGNTVNANRRYRNRRSGPQPAHAVPRGVARRCRQRCRSDRPRGRGGDAGGGVESAHSRAPDAGSRVHRIARKGGVTPLRLQLGGARPRAGDAIVPHPDAHSEAGSDPRPEPAGVSDACSSRGSHRDCAVRDSSSTGTTSRTRSRRSAGRAPSRREGDRAKRAAMGKAGDRTPRRVAGARGMAGARIQSESRRCLRSTGRCLYTSIGR